ncbi:hypothetical protein ACHAPJ_012601 [Fusarium lateritium]
MPRTQTQAAQTPTTVAVIVSMVLCIVALPFLVRPPNFDGIFGPIEKPVEDQLPKERFLINFGDSFSETGLSLNWTYARTGYEMRRFNRTSIPSTPGPRPENPIGSPEWPGKTSTGGNNWLTYLTANFNTTLTLTYNFARSGSVIDKKNIKPNPHNTTTFVDQIVHFNDSLGHRPDYAAWTAENAIGTIWLGTIDVMEAAKSRYGVDLLKVSNRRMFELILELYDIGLRQFIVMDVPPINLMPGSRPDRIGERNYEQLNRAIKTWNDLLRDNLHIFQMDYPDARISLVETTPVFYVAYLHPKKFRARNSSCYNSDGVSCLWTDRFHPGQKIHQLIGRKVAEEAWGFE